MKAAVEDFHKKEPLRPGMKKAQLKAGGFSALSPQLFDIALDDMIAKGILEEHPPWLKIADHEITLSEVDQQRTATITTIFKRENFTSPSEKDLAVELGVSIDDIRRLLGALLGMGKLLRMEGDIYFHVDTVNEARKMLLDFAAKVEEISVSQFRELLGTSRKYAMAILSHFDQMGLTQRVGEVRVVNRDK
jgi:selenocysteine-specific elongation factor